MRARNSEILYALAAIVAVTLLYLFLSIRLGSALASSSLSGHLIGVVGFVFMLMTETLYSLRKRLRRAARWGSMQSWLRFHVFTGLVGPYMVLLHTSWRFNGLAGIVTLLTVVIVASGFIGRYLYTSVPRSATGEALESGDIDSSVSDAEARVRGWLEANPDTARTLPSDIVNLPPVPYNVWPLVFGRLFADWGQRRKWWQAKRQMKGISQTQIAELGRRLTRRRELYYQMVGLALVRRLLAVWHAVHVPIGVALFSLAFVHAGAALYYVTLAR